MSARLGVDVGGTFTDLVALGPDGSVTVRKVSSTPRAPEQAVLEAVRDWQSTDRGGVEVLVHGTTVATNALLERTGARVALVTTAGFEDLLWLRRQDRAALYDLARHHPPPPLERRDVVGVRERVGPHGVVTPLTPLEIARVTTVVAALEPQAVAVCLLFAFRDPQHEQALAAALSRALPDVPVVMSSETLPVFREYERCTTTVAEAFLRPRVGGYVTRLEQALRGVPVRIMTSAGGTLVPQTARQRAVALALSGPAGGVVGARIAGAAAGERDLLTLDMGGTSADAGIVQDGAAVTAATNEVGGVPLGLHAVLVETVSAGGGSIAWADDGGALRVGPRSAGAEPGPACYGRGGTRPTVTDAALVLGWLDPDRPLAGVHLDHDAAWRAVGTLAPVVGRDVPGTAAGVVAVATVVMARALKRVSVARGVDPRRMTLVPFGGAGPLFACALADALGMPRVLVPPHPGALSALGLAAAAERVERVAALHRPLAELDAAALGAAFAPLAAAAGAELPDAVVTRVADCRFVGQGYEVSVAVETQDPGALHHAFLKAHAARYGYADGDAAVEVVNVRVVAERAVDWERGGTTPRPERRGAGAATRLVHVGGAEIRASLWDLDALAPGARIAGPAILAGGDATALVEPGWQGVVHASGALLLDRGSAT